MDMPESARPQPRKRPIRATSYLTTAAHELRNPLHTLSGYVEMLLDELPGPLTPVQREFLGHVRTSVERLHTLMEDVLLLARADAGELALHPRRFDLGLLLRECLASIPSGSGPSAALQVAIEAPAGLRITADRERLKMALARLIGTCPLLCPASSRARIVVTREDHATLIAVHIPAAPVCAGDLAAVFQRFPRVRVGDDGQQVDLGLGLAVCEAVIRLHGGTTAAMIHAPDTLVLTLGLPAARAHD